jgi:dienelactone hydrolase
VDFVHQFLGASVPKEDRQVRKVTPDRDSQGAVIPVRLPGELVFTEKCAGSDSRWVRCLARIGIHFFRPGIPGKFMPSCRAVFVPVVLGLLWAQGATAQPRFGAQGAETEPARMQQWLVPSPDPETAAHAVLFRPSGDGPFPLAVIAHASTQNVLRRAQMPQPEYRALAAWLVARGFAVLVPERLGHGATGGRYIEDQGGCDEANYAGAGHAAAGEIAAALRYLRGQSFVRQDGTIIVGHSAGAWGALALAGENPQGVAAIIAFAPGRGGHANDVPNQVCAPHTLIAAAAEFGKGARVPVTWLVAANDSYFSPELSRQLADAFHGSGGAVDFHVLPASGSEGHWLAETEAGVKSAGPELDRALKPRRPTAAKKR